MRAKFRVDPNHKSNGASVQQWRWWWPFWCYYTDCYSVGIAEKFVDQMNGRRKGGSDAG